MIAASCHCGAIKLEMLRKPRTVTDCNCSICRRYAVLWAYFKVADVKILAARGATASYVWGRRRTRFVRCSRCGCVTHWVRTGRDTDGRVGVNARNFDPRILEGIRIRHLDGALSWKYVD